MQTETNRTIHKKLFFFVGKTCTKRLHLDLCWFAFFTSHRSQVIHRLLLFVLIEKITYFLHFIVFAVRSVPSHQCETMHSYKNTNNNLMYCMRMRHITRFFFFCSSLASFSMTDIYFSIIICEVCLDARFS